MTNEEYSMRKARIQCALAAATVFFLGAVAPAQETGEPYMVLDVVKTEGTDSVTGWANSSNLENFVRAGDVAFFPAYSALTGAELWKTDGTPGGTVMVKDIAPGPESSQISNMVAMNGVAYFVARTGPLPDQNAPDYPYDHHGWRLWRSDGTADGTYIVRDYPASLRPQFSDLTVVGGRIFFVMKKYMPVPLTTSWDQELYCSDGTAEGTHLVRDINTFPFPLGGTTWGSMPRDLTDVNGTLFFTANDGIHGHELWTSDGTLEGTVLLKDIRPGLSTSAPEHLTVMEGIAYFQANDGTHGAELWRSDGSTAGTYMVRDFMPGSASSYPVQLQVHLGMLFLKARDGGFSRLWVSDGTTQSTVLLSAELKSSGPFTELGGRLFFAGTDAAHGQELWSTDGTPEGTEMIIDIWPGGLPYGSTPYSSRPRPILVHAGRLYFTADVPGTDAPFPSENILFSTDGTVEGTHPDEWPLDLDFETSRRVLEFGTGGLFDDFYLFVHDTTTRFTVVSPGVLT
jgi:ELWxxDGT repeat protein